MYRKEIVYDRETRDYAMYLDSELVGFARTYHEAEVTLDQLVFELLSGAAFRDAPVETHARMAEPAPEVVEVQADPTDEELLAEAWHIGTQIALCGGLAHAPAHYNERQSAIRLILHQRDMERHDLDNQPASDAFPDEPIGDCALCGTPAWRLDETLIAPLCPDHKALEQTWIANRNVNLPVASSAASDSTPAQEPAPLTSPSSDRQVEPMIAAGTVWAPGPPPPPEPPAPAEPAPAPASALVALLRMALEEWAELNQTTPYDTALAQLARLLNPPTPGYFLSCTVCGGPHVPTQCPQTVAEKLRQRQQIRFGLTIHASYIERRATLALILRDSDDERRAEMAEALALYLTDATGVALPAAMVLTRFNQLAA